MRQTNGTRKSPGEKIVKDIKRATRKQYSSEEKIKIVLDGLRDEDNETLSAIGPRTVVECRTVPSIVRQLIRNINERG
ncbi:MULTISPECIES: hypothetical protein [Falsihalocynthiibacter]|uniref:hypothetical protein n=1 Tax=Falsihalocynthiibacter TaxID=2854182 RepID=UPI0035101969